MNTDSTHRADNTIVIFMLIYGAASLAHFAHNAVYISDYPNLPAWLSAGKVWLAWFGVAATGIAGYALIRFGYRLAGLLVSAVYAGLGFDGLAHYGVASFSQHTWAMNLTIWTEVVAAAVLTIVIVRHIVAHISARLTTAG